MERKLCKIAIASGKGGTGKTTLSVSLYQQLKDRFEGKIQLVDCDVEEPNDLLFFSSAKLISSRPVYQLIPEIDTGKCNFCRKCADYCEFNAIVVIPPAGFAEVNSSLCHSCGACLIACDQGAITEHPVSIGDISTYQSEAGDNLAEGKLKIGSAMQTMLIKELKKEDTAGLDMVIYDAPPGTSCPVVATVSDADYVVLVTEPTLFGLHDFKLMVELMRELKIPFGTVVNKAGLGDEEVYNYIRKEKIELLGKIPFNRDFASKYAKANLFSDIPGNILENLKKVADRIVDVICNEIEIPA
ncbi:MAG: ATP-binding protein [Bacteroidales bacterium]|nr:ATP-binding protein [Bacteroidales bacterium]